MSVHLWWCWRAAPIAGLSALSVVGQSFTSSFSTGLYAYTVNIPSTGAVQTVQYVITLPSFFSSVCVSVSCSSLTCASLLCRVQATSLESRGTIALDLFGPFTGSFSVSGVPLNYPGSTTLVVVSTSDDGSNQLNYTITVNLVLSTVSTLSSLTVNPSFPLTLTGTTYNTTVAFGTTQLVSVRVCVCWVCPISFVTSYPGSFGLCRFSLPLQPLWRPLLALVPVWPRARSVLAHCRSRSAPTHSNSQSRLRTLHSALCTVL